MVANAVLRPLRLGLAIACGSKVEQLSLLFQDYVQCDKTKATLMTAVLLYSMALAYTAGCFLAASAFSGVALFPSSWKDNTTTTRSYLVSPQIQDERFILTHASSPTMLILPFSPALQASQSNSTTATHFLFSENLVHTTRSTQPFRHDLTCTQYHLVEGLSNYHESPGFVCGQQSNRVVPSSSSTKLNVPWIADIASIPSFSVDNPSTVAVHVPSCVSRPLANSKSPWKCRRIPQRAWATPKLA